MPKRKAVEPYHHGNLRQALLEVSLDVLAERGLADFSLRAVARAAGVTTGAPYHHFADRAELLAALAEVAFADLASKLRASQAAVSAPARLRSMTLAYLAFARDNPVRYSLMYLPEIENRTRFASLHATAWRCMEEVVEALALALPAASRNELLARGLGVWAACHGYAALQLGGVLDNRPELPAQRTLAEALVDQIQRGALGETRQPRSQT